MDNTHTLSLYDLDGGHVTTVQWDWWDVCRKCYRGCFRIVKVRDTVISIRHCVHCDGALPPLDQLEF